MLENRHAPGNMSILVNALDRDSTDLTLD